LLKKCLFDFVNLGCFDRKILKFRFVVNTHRLLLKLGQVKLLKVIKLKFGKEIKYPGYLL